MRNSTGEKLLRFGWLSSIYHFFHQRGEAYLNKLILPQPKDVLYLTIKFNYFSFHGFTVFSFCACHQALLVIVVLPLAFAKNQMCLILCSLPCRQRFSAWRCGGNLALKFNRITAVEPCTNVS